LTVGRSGYRTSRETPDRRLIQVCGRRDLLQARIPRVPEPLAEQRLRALQRVTDAALSSLPLEKMLEELLARVTELLRVDTAAILLIDDDGRTLVPRASKGLEEEVNRRVRIPLGRGFAGRIAHERRPVRITDVEHADIYNPILREKGLRALLGVPLMLETRVMGVLHVGTLEPRDFGDDDVDLLRRAADRAAMAIGGRLAERERGLADAFQESLIPPLPTVPGIGLAARYRPAASAHLGGDWYDAFVLPTGALGVAIGDVVGRGFHAAALMGQLRSAVRAYALDNKTPKQVLEGVSAVLRQLQPGWGATLLYGVLEPHLAQATIATAAHPAPLVLDVDGRARFIELAPSVPLAAVRSPAYEETEIEFPAGSTLILYTDGLVEQRGESMDTGLERLRSAADGSGEDPQPLTDRLLRTLRPTQTGVDDVAILAVSMPQLPDPFEMTLPVEPDAIALMRRVMARWLHAAGASAAEVGEITLACSEACANAIEHAYDPGASDLVVEASSTADEVTVVVKDTGRWRDPRGTNRGRGMTLMEGLMDRVEVDRAPGGTAVHLSRKLAAQAPS
jgi:anti-sigma regulatory factor (Ser/Thr protein kinase)/putative methionine-R-sulfoxide reductase with GAF domain